MSDQYTIHYKFDAYPNTAPIELFHIYLTRSGTLVIPYEQHSNPDPYKEIYGVALTQEQGTHWSWDKNGNWAEYESELDITHYAVVTGMQALDYCPWDKS